MVQAPDKTQADSSEDENSEEEDETLHEFNKTDKIQGKKKGNMGKAGREICEVLKKGDEDMEESLTQLGVRIDHRLVKMVLKKTSSPSLALRFFQWAKLQPGFTHNTLTYNKLTNLLGSSKDFETLQKILTEMLPARRNYSVKTFTFATAWHDDLDMLNKVIEMIDKLELSPRRHAYEMLIAALCEENHASAALGVLEKMVRADCVLRAATFRPLLTVFCLNDQMDKVQVLFEMMKMTGCPPDSITYNLVFSKLCHRKRFVEAAEMLESMVDSGCKPNAATYDIMINSACKTGRVEGALQLLDKMKEEGITPLYGTYSYLLKGLLLTRGFEVAYSFLIQQSGTDPNLDSGNYKYLIRICHKSGLEEEARHLLTEMKAKDSEILVDRWYTEILHENNESKLI
jgi:pentatricopeptide repeat protein